MFPDSAQAALSLRVLGSNIILVDDAVAPNGKLIPLHPGSLVTFAFQGTSTSRLYLLPNTRNWGENMRFAIDP